MPPGPTRRFAGQSRAVNSNSGRKGTKLRQSLESSYATSGVMLGQEPGNDHFADATGSLSPMDLTLPPFKYEQDEHPTTMTSDSGKDLGAFACQVVDEDSLDDVAGMPTRAQWKSIVENYLACLHPSKRDKSLISQEVYKMIFRTLKDPDATRLGTPQFRFWARKMFQLVNTNNMLVVTNAGRPVAIKEHIYDILCICHAECKHGGRDKTCKVLREYYTWVPKELISNFVKECPTCAPRKLATSKSKDKRADKTPALIDERLLAPRYSVERIQDFGLPSPVSDGPRGLKLPPLSGYPTLSTSQAARPGSCFIQARFPADNSAITLPPLGGGQESNFNPSSDPVKQMPLPPLIQYLARNYDFKNELQSQADEDADGPLDPDIPIDPALLHSTSSQAPGNVLHLQFHAPLRHDGQVATGQALGLAMEAGTASPTVTWEFPSVASMYGGEGDNSALYSASTASVGLPTPSHSGQIFPVGPGYINSLGYYSPVSQPASGFIVQSGLTEAPRVKVEAKLLNSPPLFSPRPVKAQDTQAVLEMAAAEMEEIST